MHINDIIKLANSFTVLNLYPNTYIAVRIPDN